MSDRQWRILMFWLAAGNLFFLPINAARAVNSASLITGLLVTLNAAAAAMCLLTLHLMPEVEA